MASIACTTSTRCAVSMSAPSLEASAPTKPRPGRPDGKRFKDLPITAWTGSWSTDSIQRAIDAHDQGNFLLTSQLAEQTQRDDRVFTGLNTRAKGLMGLPLLLSPAKGHPNVALAEEVATRLRRELDATDWKGVMIQALRWLIMMGFALIEIVWSGDENGWTFELRSWHPRYVWFNWQTRRFVVNTAEGPVEISPGDGKWILLTFEGDYRAWMQGAVRSVSIPWLGRQWSFRDQMRFNEVYGLGIRKAIVPAGTSEEDKDRFFRELSTIGSEPTVICPRDENDHGYDVELMEATSTGFQTFASTTADCDKRITLVLNGQNLTTEVKGGSFAAASVHENVLQDWIEADEKAAMGGLARQLFRIWALYNFGDADIAPTVRLDIEPPENQAQRADTVAKVATAVTALAAVPSAQVDARALVQSFDLPVTEAAAPGAAPAAPSAPPAASSSEPTATSTLAAVSRRFPQFFAMLEQLEREASAAA